jgi:hypothetical protein
MKEGLKRSQLSSRIGLHICVLRFPLISLWVPSGHQLLYVVTAAREPVAGKGSKTVDIRE